MALSGSVSTNKYDNKVGLTCTWTATQSVTENKSILTWTLASDGSADFSYRTGNLNLVINGETVYYVPATSSFVMRGGGYWSTTGTCEIPHDSDGAKTFTISISAGLYAYSSSNCTGSGTFTLNQIPRKSILSASNGTLGTAQTLTVTKQASSFTHTITYSCGSASGTICTKSSNTSISWTPPIELARQNTTNSSVTVTLKIETFSGSTSIGDPDSIIISCAIPASVAPSISILVSDANGWDSRFGGYVQNKSACKVETASAGSYGSTIKSYSITCDGQSSSKSSETFNLPKAGTITVTAKVTDSRGRTASASKTINVLAYTNPAVTSVDAFRSDVNGNADNGGSYMCVKFSAAIASLSNLNTARYSVEYRTSGSSSWSNVTPSASGYSPTNVSTVIAANTGSSYEVRVVAADTFSSAASPINTVMSIYALMHIDKNNNRIGLGKVAEGTDVLDVGLNTHFRGNVEFDTIPPQVSSSAEFNVLNDRLSGFRAKSMSVAASSSVKIAIDAHLFMIGRYASTAASAPAVYAFSAYNKYRAPVMAQLSEGTYISVAIAGDNTNGWYIEITNTGATTVLLYFFGNAEPQVL